MDSSFNRSQRSCPQLNERERLVARRFRSMLNFVIWNFADVNHELNVDVNLKCEKIQTVGTCFSCLMSDDRSELEAKD